MKGNDSRIVMSLPLNENDYTKINRIGGRQERKNHCKSRGSMTVIDPLLQKTDQSAHVPFEREFKVGSMPLHDRDGRTLTHTRRSDIAVPVTGICVLIRYSADIEENATSVKERDEQRYVVSL